MKNVIGQIYVNARMNNGLEHCVIKHQIVFINMNNTIEQIGFVHILHNGIRAIKFLAIFEKEVFFVFRIIVVFQRVDFVHDIIRFRRH
jgi:hypothetical protein